MTMVHGAAAVRQRRRFPAVAIAGIGLLAGFSAPARATEPIDSLTRLACTSFEHTSADGESLSYRDYWEHLTLGGGEYHTSTLGKFGKSTGGYTVDARGTLRFDGFLSAMSVEYEYTGQRENALRKTANVYTMRFIESDGTTHTASCTVMGRDAAPPPPPTAAPTGQAALNGLYYYWTPDFYSPEGIKLSSSVYYFFMPNGYVHEGIPSGGLRKVDCGVLPYKRKCRTYQLRGNRLEISGKATEPFSRTGENLLIGERKFWPAKAVSAATLPGSYKFNWSAAGGGHTSWWTFNRDGSFKQTGVGTTGVPALFGIEIGPSIKEANGTWRVEGHSLKLRYSNGQEREHTLVHSFGDADEITIDGNQCFRIK